MIASGFRCRRCNRPIKAARSVSRQCGPVCWRSFSVYAEKPHFKVNREMGDLDERAARAFGAPW
ncbi:hypothetical protein OUW_17516 [Mycobacteroides abscessus M93]|nr:hypothetical protein OUW_17516 [Mycobacteroides abscessus M93]